MRPYYTRARRLSIKKHLTSVLAGAVTDATNDQQPAGPLAQATLAILAPAGRERPQEASGAVDVSPASLDHGDDSAGAVQAWRPAGLPPTEPRGASSTTSRQPRRAPPPHGAGAHGRDSAHPGRAHVVRQTHGHRRASIWPAPRSAGMPSLPAARVAAHPWCMASRVPDPSSAQNLAPRVSPDGDLTCRKGARGARNRPSREGLPLGRRL